MNLWTIALTVVGLLGVTAVRAAEVELPDADATRRVVAAVVAEAKRIARAGVERSGDELTDAYVRAAAAEAKKLPKDQAVPAFLAALGIALDDSTTVRGHPLFGPFFRRIEPDADRKERLRVLGAPSLRKRRDWCQHFAVSCTLTALTGAAAAEAAGLFKERLDMRPGGSGFSFADLSADYAGVAFAVRLREGTLSLDAVAERFTGNDFLPDPKGLREGLTAKQFEEEYGNTSDDRFRKETEGIRRRVRELSEKK
jgi:hypothetical protein